MSEDAAHSLSKSRKTLLRVASIMLLVASFAVYLNAFRNDPQVLFAVPCWLVGQFASTFVHECGHAAAAHSCNWRVIMFVVRPFGFQMPNRDFVLLTRKVGGANSGWIATVPRDISSGTKASWSVILAAGAVASFLFALVTFSGWATFLRDFDTADVRVSRIGLGLGLQSLHSCIFTILPNGFSDTRTDGTKLRALRGIGSSFETTEPFVWLLTLVRNKVRLRDRPDWLIDAVRNMPDISTEMTKVMEGYEISLTMDEKQVDICRARALIDQYREKHGASDWLNACDAYLSAVWEADAQRATATISLAPYPDEKTPMFLAAEAAVAARLGQSTTAISKLRDMEKTLKRESPFRDLTFKDIRRQVEAVQA